MNVTLKGTNVEITPTTRTFVEAKLADASRAFGRMDTDSVDALVELIHDETVRDRTSGNPFRVVATIPVQGSSLRAEAADVDMRKAIVQMKHVLTRQIRDWRTRHQDSRRKGARRATAVVDPVEPDAPLELEE